MVCVKKCLFFYSAFIFAYVKQTIPSNFKKIKLPKQLDKLDGFY
ncbi:hypothetical protein LSAJ156_290019 [Latilactobacillus sakei]|nr:hypothetical protein LSAJ160_160010 [Latilactobacillus sakei]SOB38622.1 hypothetical protein LSAJ156_290019 [Latilactobacillus sakei]SOB43482.1 hypothetical protein LSAJ112_220016 [Latilactobacillus sakei]SON65397.1 protein of unknown function [Latilactobacillus sakei]SON69489.1 protein of unknown function [Latilactobacillus sakei]